VSHDLNPPVTARYIRFQPIASRNWVAMRVELYGCQGIAQEFNVPVTLVFLLLVSLFVIRVILLTHSIKKNNKSKKIIYFLECSRSVSDSRNDPHWMYFHMNVFVYKKLHVFI